MSQTTYAPVGEGPATINYSIDEKLDKLLGLVAEVRAAQLATPAPAAGKQFQQSSSDVLSFDKLSEQWANKAVYKDPTKWIKDGGASHQGIAYADCPADYMKSLAGYLQFKADMSQKETPVRMNKSGKPYWEVDAFEAKIVRTWVAFKESDTMFNG